MASTVQDPNIATPAASDVNYLNATKGLMSWLTTVDHKRIGIMYLMTVLTFFLVGGIAALVVRIHLMSAVLVDGTVVNEMLSPDAYNKAFTIHGTVMTFLVLVPSIPAVLGNFLLPLMLGTKDVAFPKLNLASYYIYLIGGLFFVGVLIFRQLDTGWTFYTPYSDAASQTNVVLATMGAFIVGFSSILTGVNFIVTIHKMRAPGMTWRRLPLMVWSLYAAAVIQVLATPVVGITMLLLFFERVAGIGVFDPALGGDPILFESFFWFYSHPVVYVMILPAFGVMSELFATHSRKHIFGYDAIAASSVAIAIISFLVWGHHLFVSGQSPLASSIFSLLTFGVAVPTSIKFFSWIATMYKGSIQLNAPFYWALCFLFLFAIGGLTGMFLGTLATDVHVHDTYFVVSHFHYTMMGGTLIAFIAGLFHWWPKMWGKMYIEPIGTISAFVTYIGFNLTFIPQFVMGTRGMPRRYHGYLEEFHIFHELSSIGSFVLAAGLTLAAISLFGGLFRKEKAPHNPWGGMTLEWKAATPPVQHNFEEVVVVEHDPYYYPEIDYDNK